VSEGAARRREAWRLLGRLIARRKWGVAAAISAGLSWQAAAILAPVIAAHAIDAIQAGDRHGVYVWAAVAAGVGVVEAIAGGLRHITAMRNRGYGLAILRGDILRHALRLDARYHDRFPPGELMSRSTSDAELAARVLEATGHTSGYLVTVIGAAVAMLIFDPTLALMVLAPLPLISFGFWRYARRYADRTGALQDELGRQSALVEETVTGIRVIKGLGAGAALSARFRETSDRVYDKAMAVARVDAVFLPSLEVLPLLEQVLVWPLRVLGQRVSTVQNAVAAAERMVDALSPEPEVREAPNPRGTVSHGRLQFDAVRFGYDPASPVLDGFTLDVPAGASVALVGRTGSGKSTIAALLGRFYDPQSGSIAIDGRDVREYPLTELRRAVALVAEDTYLFTATVRSNIAYARPDASEDDVIAAARAAGAHEFVERLPDGYDTILGERGYTLSGGQRQRLAIARAVLADPEILVLDDATSSVDAAKEHEIRSALEAVMARRTTIVIAHRPATIALAERVVVLEDGRVVEEGTHRELLARSARYRELLALDDEEAA
jgi:ATP-binding cassette subfamily B protein